MDKIGLQARNLKQENDSANTKPMESLEFATEVFLLRTEYWVLGAVPKTLYPQRDLSNLT